MKEIDAAFGNELTPPAFNEQRWVSSFNWLPEVRDQMSEPEFVHIHDVTLRDGEQTARIAFTPQEKLFLAGELDKLGVHSIEPGLPATSEDREVMAELSKMGLRAKIVPLVRVKESDVRASLDANVDGLLLEFGINPYIMRDVYNTDPASLISQIAEYAREAKDAGKYVEFMGWDVLRIPDIDFVRSFFTDLVDKAELDRITIADTFGMGHPFAIHHLIGKLKSWTGKPVGFHIHNDYCMATANSVMAVSAGADMIHSSINGLGERAGNVATEEIAFVLQHLLDIEAGIELERLKPISDVVAEISKARPARNKPVVGDGLFEIESGIVVHAAEKIKQAGFDGGILPFKPGTVGHRPVDIVYGRGTGQHSVNELLASKGYSVTEQQAARITQTIKSTGLQLKNGLPDSFVNQIIQDELHSHGRTN